MPGKSIFNAIDIKPENGVASKVRLLDAAGAYAVELVAPAGMTGPVSMGLPATTGAANEVLTADGLGGQYWSPGVAGPTGPAGATGATGPAGVGGKVLQVVSASTTTTVSVATTTYTDTTLSATITPTSATSKILILVQQQAFYSRSQVSQGVGVRILRDATVIFTPASDANGPYMSYRANANAASQTHYENLFISHTDSPNTTSPLTYKTQGRPFFIANSGIANFQTTEPAQNGTSTIVLMEIAP